MGKRILEEKTWINADGDETTDPAEGVVLVGPTGREVSDEELERLRAFVALKGRPAATPAVYTDDDGSDTDDDGPDDDGPDGDDEGEDT